MYTLNINVININVFRILIFDFFHILFLDNERFILFIFLKQCNEAFAKIFHKGKSLLKISLFRL